jgi:hypothetical protein
MLSHKVQNPLTPNNHESSFQITFAYYVDIVRISGESPCGGGGCGLWCGSGGKCTGVYTTGLLFVENSMTHQGVTLLHTD